MVVAHRTRLYNNTGEKLVNFLVEPKKGTKWPSNLPRFANRREAIAVCKELCRNQYLLRSEKRGKGELGVRFCCIYTVCAMLYMYASMARACARVLLEPLRVKGTC
jgi:hypothetical protein